MARIFKMGTLGMFVVWVNAGCANTDHPEARELRAQRAASPIQLDGHLDKPVWRTVEPLAFEVPTELRRQGQSLEEGGTVRLLWDDKFLYVAFDLTDSDVVALGHEEDEGHHQLGDVAEIFLKPTAQPWYWEFHVTPLGYVTQYWCVGRGRWGLKDPDRRVKATFLNVVATVQGTLNDWHDCDKGWTAEVAIPFDKLDRFGELPNPKENWMILLSRYNYTRYRTGATGPELSSWPLLSRPFYHLVEEYAQLKLVP